MGSIYAWINDSDSTCIILKAYECRNLNKTAVNMGKSLARYSIDDATCIEMNETQCRDSND